MDNEGQLSFQHAGHNPSPREIKAGTQSKNLEAGTEADVIDKCCCACSVCVLIQPGPFVQGWYHPHWTGPSCIKHQENAHRYRGDYFNEVPYSQTTLASVKLTKKLSNKEIITLA